MTEAEQRAAVVAEARTWLRTPYHPGAQVKGAGVDCAHLPLAVYVAVGVIPPTDVGEYPTDWHLHRDDERYLGWVQRFAREISRADIQPGDFGLWRYGRAYSHGAIIIDPPVIIHACREAQIVTLENMDLKEDLKPGGRPARFFSAWGHDGR